MSIRVIAGTAAGRRRTPLEDAYDQFRLERQGNRLSPRTLAAYDYHMDRFFRWLRTEHPQVRQFKDLTVDVMRVYRAEMASRDGDRGRPLSAETLQDSHATIRIFLRWADNEGYKVDARLLKLPRVKVPAKEPTVYHIAQLRQILAACNPAFPQQDLAVRILVGSGVRISELCGIAVEAPDGLPDLMLDSVERGRVELRVRWDGGAKGKKSRRVPITPKLASAIKRYQARQRPDVEVPELLISSRHAPYDAAGIDTMLDRLQSRGRVPYPRPRVPPHLRDGGLPDGLELRAAARGDGPRRLQHAPEVRPPRHRARPGPEEGVGRVHPRPGEARPMTRPEQTVIGTTWRSYVAEAPAWGIVAGALAVSFWTQVGEVERHGFAAWEALIWGSSTDAGTIACLFLAREGAHRGTPTWGAWVLSIACAALSVQFNVMAGVQRGDWLSVEAHVWMPALALGVWYWLLHGRHRRWTRERSSVDADAATPRPSTSVDERVIDLVRTNPRATWRTVMARTGLSDANSKRALTAARRMLRGEELAAVEAGR